MKTNNPENWSEQDTIISYKQLRMFIGLSGFFLTFLLVLTSYLMQDISVFKVSISHYYYSFGHIIFTGTLCILGGLFLTYRGKDRWENRLSNCTGLFAICVATFPTRFEGYEGIQYVLLDQKYYPCWMNYVHFGSAFLLFLSFAIFCLYFFQKQDESEPQSTVQQNKKKNRNRYYQFCGWGILLSITMIAVFSFVFKEEDYPNNTFIKYSTIIFETTALFFFSTSWLMKSSDILSPKIPLLRYFR